MHYFEGRSSGAEVGYSRLVARAGYMRQISSSRS
jgi:hypothetical protein